MRDVNRYKAVNGVLRWDLWARKDRVPPPFSRPVIDSGEAFKTVYLSKAPAHFTHEDMEKALNHHVRAMQKELQAQDRMVTSIVKTLRGEDAVIHMKWVVYGAKRNKHWRRLHGKIGRVDASSLESVKGSTAEPGPPAVSTDLPQGGVPL